MQHPEQNSGNLNASQASPNYEALTPPMPVPQQPFPLSPTPNPSYNTSPTSAPRPFPDLDFTPLPPMPPYNPNAAARLRRVGCGCLGVLAVAPFVYGGRAAKWVIGNTWEMARGPHAADENVFQQMRHHFATPKKPGYKDEWDIDGNPVRAADQERLVEARRYKTDGYDTKVGFHPVGTTDLNRVALRRTEGVGGDGEGYGNSRTHELKGFSGFLRKHGILQSERRF